MTDMTDTNDTSNVRHLPPPNPQQPRLRDVLDHVHGHPSTQGTHVAGLPITKLPPVSHDVAALGAQAFAACTITVDADRIGFHVEPASGDRNRADFLTIAPTWDFAPVVLLGLPGMTDAAARVLDVVTAAITDGLSGSIELELRPWGAPLAGWWITSAIYTDSEGVRHS